VHEEGIIHGDIKPSNVLLRDEECRSAVLADVDLSHDSASRTTTRHARLDGTRAEEGGCARHGRL